MQLTPKSSVSVGVELELGSSPTSYTGSNQYGDTSAGRDKYKSSLASVDE